MRTGQIVAVLVGSTVSVAGHVAHLRRDRRDDVVMRAGGMVASTCMWRMGPAFIKVGQMMSTRKDVLPSAFCEELESGLARGRAGTTTGAAASETDVEMGSVAMVRRCRIDGVDVAVKTVHPGAVEQLRLDLDLITAFTDVTFHFLRRSGGPLRGIVREMCESVRQQTDLVVEGRTLQAFADLERTLPVVFPRVRDAASNADQLVMTWLDGQPETRSFVNRKRAAKRLVLAVYEMLFVTGVVHCDLHPGNWWEMPDGRLAIVDAGFSYELDEDMRTHFAEFFLGMSSGNAEVCATHALAAVAEPISEVREVGFRQDMEELIATTTGLTAGSFSLAGFATRFFAIQRRHHAYSKAEFIFPFMALLSIEGQVKELDPGINFQAMASPVVLRAIVNRARTGTSRLSSQAPIRS